VPEESLSLADVATQMSQVAIKALPFKFTSQQITAHLSTCHGPTPETFFSLRSHTSGIPPIR